MSKQFEAPNGVFVYPHKVVKGETLTIRPGDKVIVGGKEIKATWNHEEAERREKEEIIDTGNTGMDSYHCCSNCYRPPDPGLWL